MPDNSKPPTSESGHFTGMKVLSYGFLFSLVMLGMSSFVMPQNMQYWGYIVAVLGGYLVGNAKSKVDPPN